jgi:hypothetical protein
MKGGGKAYRAVVLSGEAGLQAEEYRHRRWSFV